VRLTDGDAPVVRTIVAAHRERRGGDAGERHHRHRDAKARVEKGDVDEGPGRERGERTRTLLHDEVDRERHRRDERHPGQSEQDPQADHAEEREAVRVADRVREGSERGGLGDAAHALDEVPA
jgi:hypothetical protein